MNKLSILSKYNFLLKNEEEETNNIEENKCLISQQKIDDFNIVKLPCGHIFDYINLYNEIKYQKLHDYTNIKKYYGFNCPYCRKIYNKTLPYYEIDEVEKIPTINYNKNISNILELHTCKWEFKTGKSKGNLCGKTCNKYKCGSYCENHLKLYINRNNRNKPNNRCRAILKSGKNKGKLCSKNCKENTNYCYIHLKKYNDNINSNNNCVIINE